MLIQQYLRADGSTKISCGDLDYEQENYFLMTSYPSQSHHLFLATKKIKDRLIEGIAEAFLRMNSPTIAIPSKQPWIFGNV